VFPGVQMRNHCAIAYSFEVSGSNRIIRYSLPWESHVSMRMFDIRGKRSFRLVNSRQMPGVYCIPLGSRSYSAGLYVISFKAGDFSAVRRAVMLR
jgi:hypothetical protein